MDKPTSMPEVKPEIVFIFELVRDVASGKVRIPNFQRPFVWRRQQMLDLLDSIRLQFPIGSLLVWETDARLSSVRWVGPVPVPSQTEGTVKHVLDGHQRLSTLAGTLMALRDDQPVREDDDDPDRWRIWFNAKDGVFEHPKPGTSLEPWHFPLWKLMDTIEFLEECNRMLRDGKTEANSYVQAVQDLARTFQAYKLPVISIKNTELNQAVEIFARLNSKGQPMTADQMVSALTYREDSSGQPSFNLAGIIDDFLKVLDDLGFGGIDRTIVLRALLAALKEDIYRTDWTRLSDPKKQDLLERFPIIVDETRDALKRAANFLQSLGVYNDRLLPYSMQLVVLSAFYKECRSPTPEQIAFLRRWFWVSSFTGWFASGNPSRVSALVVEFRDSVAKRPNPDSLENMRLDEPAQPFPTSFDMRSARTRTLLLVLLSLKPKDKEGDTIEKPWQQIGMHGPNAIGRIAATVHDAELVASPANRILRIDMEDRSQAKSWLVNLKDTVRNAVLQSHGIPADAIVQIQANNAEAFLQRRRDYLIEVEKQFMEREDVKPPLDMQPKPAPIDAD